MFKEAANNIKSLHDDILKHIDGGKKAEILRTGVKTVIIGEPNVGKSSLLNNLCKFFIIKLITLFVNLYLPSTQYR